MIHAWSGSPVAVQMAMAAAHQRESGTGTSIIKHLGRHETCCFQQGSATGATKVAMMHMPGVHTFGGKAAIAEAHDSQATCKVYTRVTTWTSTLLPEAAAALIQRLWSHAAWEQAMADLASKPCAFPGRPLGAACTGSEVKTVYQASAASRRSSKSTVKIAAQQRGMSTNSPPW